MAVQLIRSIGPTPLAMLFAVLEIALAAGAVLLGVGFVFRDLIDRRWPADEPLNPAELAWSRVGELVARTFKGLELEMAKELAGRMEEVKVPAGSIIIRQGDEANSFFIIQEGEVEVSQQVAAGDAVAQQVIRHMGPGQFFGELAILRRTKRTASVRARSDCVLLRLSADDLIEGAARSAADEHLLLRTVDQYISEDRARAARLADGIADRRRR